MATNNFSNFGVPLDGAALGVLHPQQKYRFRAVFTNFGENNGLRQLTANVIKCQKPTITYKRITLHSYNSVMYVAGKHEFNEIEVTLRDDLTQQVITALGAQIQKQMNHFEQTSAVAGINYKFQMNIDALDGTMNDALSSWGLYGCYITEYSTEEGDYSSGEPVTVKMKISFDNAVQQAG